MSSRDYLIIVLTLSNQIISLLQMTTCCFLQIKIAITVHLIYNKSNFSFSSKKKKTLTRLNITLKIQDSSLSTSHLSQEDR